MPEFVPGLELSRAFYEDVVAQMLGETPHAAARIGCGSDVLGLDTERSTDHGWGPRVQVFVEASEVARVRRIVESELPDEYAGWPTRFGWDEVPVSHHVEVDTLGAWFQRRFGFEPLGGVATRDWLRTPQQLLLEATAGAVFHDATGDLTRARATIEWYPDDVWLWLIACQWRRIDQEEPFVGRAAEVGDHLGARVLAARLVRDAMRLSFMQERRYAPYSKWLGSAFRSLDAARTLSRPLDAALEASEPSAREVALVGVVRELARRHNMLGLTAAVDENVGLFHTRPYRVLGSARFVDACLARVGDETLRVLPPVGAIDQWVDSTDVLSEPAKLPAIASAYDAWLATSAR
ncbi:MAG TPA: DUF4037 domain-containing protein [Gaiellaceae bacterium]|nr:DUF4037 domain-containing protein [Gaiellaceae bacterium]